MRDLGPNEVFLGEFESDLDFGYPMHQEIRGVVGPVPDNDQIQEGICLAFSDLVSNVARSDYAGVTGDQEVAVVNDAHRVMMVNAVIGWVQRQAS